jgi:hypothetical protein
MQFLRVDRGFSSHPKTLRLCRLLQSELAEAYVVRLWAWAIEYAADGDLSKFDPLDLEAAVRWRGEEGACYEAMVKAGFIDAADRRRLHGWEETNGYWVDKAEREREATAKRVAKHRAKSAPSAELQDVTPPVTRYTPESNATVTGKISPIGEDRIGDQIRSDPPLPPIGGSDEPKDQPSDRTEPEQPAEPAEPARARKPRRSQPPADADFVAWWSAYPRRVARAEAEKAWAQVAADRPPLADLLAALAWQRGLPDWRKDGGRFVPHGATYLRAKRWADEPQASFDAQKPVGPRYCGFHARPLNIGTPAPAPIADCPECKHFAAKARDRPSEPESAGSILASIPIFGGAP